MYIYLSHAPPQPHVSTTQVGTHPVRSVTTYKRSASTALAGTHNPVGADSRARTGPFPKPRALVLPMVKFGQSKPDGLGHIDTADSDLMHHQYRLFVLQWTRAQRAETPPQRLADSFMRLFFKKPVIMSRTSPISSLRILVTRTLLSNSTRTPSSPTLRCLPSGKTPQAKVLGAWVYSSFEHCCAASPPFGTSTVTFCSVHIHNVVAKKLSHPLIFFSGFTGT